MAPEEPGSDPGVRQLREEISDNDLALVQAMNKRIKLVARMKEYKASRGYDFLDPDREEWMLRYLLRASSGPLTEEGLRELFEAVLALTKRQVELLETRAGEPAA
jgi:chorismate mutase